MMVSGKVRAMNYRGTKAVLAWGLGAAKNGHIELGFDVAEGGRYRVRVLAMLAPD
jgi:hypothetical protein